MFSLALLPLLTSLLSTSVTSYPQLSPRASDVLNNTQAYYLRTRPNSTNTLYADLYLETYHTGAGLNDAVLVPGPPNGATDYTARAFLNSTDGNNNSTAPPANGYYQEFDLGNAFPYGMDMNGEGAYAAWAPVQVNAGLGNPGFVLDAAKGLVWNETAFGGWLVCAWWDSGLPQLFWYQSYYDVSVPDSCNFVDLIPEYF
ncbi:MAG: hypothetical protein M1822_005933 [Bathelium mastoideum]|nr:MAG: hypothetical protein M1822_005933 [Bathelium mastoideum]